ncbi:MAG: exopolysaccharide Pel transporter PelG [Nitrospinaceae bacterium]
MAGIGFLLRKLINKDHLSGILGGYLFSALITTGPWLFTILALGGIALFGERFASPDQMLVFRLVIIYNFSFSLVISGPITMVITRYLSDKIYQRDISELPNFLFGSLILIYTIQLPIAYFFYLYYVDLELNIAFAAIINYLLISGIWLVSVFISTLKDYVTISLTFALGMAVAVLASFYSGQKFSEAGIIWGFNLGLGIILFVLFARILSGLQYKSGSFWGFMGYFRKFWDLALCGLGYNLAIWVDKWIMWFSPKAQALPNGFVSYPYYDTAMFIAYLTIVPSMAVFFVNIETSFFEKYINFYNDIQQHAPLKKIEQNQSGIIRNLFESSRNLIIFQGLISFLAIFLAPRLFDLLKINYLLLGMFRLGVLGAFFHVLSLFLFIILFYFDFRRTSLGLILLMFSINAIFTWVSMKMGFPFYGYGYFLSSLVTFTLTFFITFYYIGTLAYRTFVKNNPSLR